MAQINSDWRQNYTFTTDKVVAVTILAVTYTLIHLLGIISYVSRRNKHYISGKLNKLALAQTLGGFLLGMYQFYDYGTKYSACAVQLWTLHFASILYFMPVICNCIRVFYITKMGQEVLRGYAQEETRLFTSTFGKILYHTLNTVYFDKQVAYPGVKKLEFPFWISSNLRKYQIITRMDDLLFIITMIFAFVMLIFAMFIQFFGVSHRVLPVLDINNCVAGKDIYFVYSVILILVIVLTPMAVASVKKVKDNYGIVSESFYICGINIWFILMYIIWAALIIPFNDRMADQFPPQAWIILMTLVTFAISLLIPIKRSFSKSKVVSYDRFNFNRLLLTQPKEWDIFEAGVIADFASHLLVFELHMQELVENIYYLSPGANVLSDNYVKGQTYVKYSEIIRLYFCPDSPFCLPLANDWLNEIQEKLESKKVTVGVFDETRNYINDFLFINTYSRIPEFQIIKENSSEFLYSRHLSQIQPPSTKFSKDLERQSQAPSMTEVSSNVTSFVTETDFSLPSPYRTSIQVPSPLTTHASFAGERRESTGGNLRHLYPIGMSSNRPSANVGSLIVEKDENSPYVPYFAKDADRKTEYVMDDKSFRAVDIDGEQIPNIEPLVKRYKTLSQATASPDSLKLPGANADTPKLSVAKTDSLILSVAKKNQSVTFVSPTPSTDSFKSPDSVKFSGNYSRFFESYRSSRLSTGTSTDGEESPSNTGQEVLSNIEHEDQSNTAQDEVLSNSVYSSKRYSTMQLGGLMNLGHSPTSDTDSPATNKTSTSYADNDLTQNRHFFVIEEEDSLKQE